MDALTPTPLASAPGCATEAASSQAIRPALALATQERLFILFLVLTDAVLLAAAFRLAFWTRFDLGLTLAPDVVPHPEFYRAVSLLLVPVWIGLFAAAGLYDPLSRRGGAAESARTFQACSIGTLLLIASTFFTEGFVVSRVWLLGSWGFSFLAVAVGRLFARRVLYACRRRGYLLTPAVIVGTNPEARSLASFLEDVQGSGVRLRGFVTTGRPGDPADGVPVLGDVTDVARIVEQHDIRDLIVAITALSREELLTLCEAADTLPVQLRLSSGLYELLTTRVTVHTLGYMPVMTLQKTRLAPGEAAVKSILEYAIAAAALLLLMPVFAAIAVLIRLDSRGPVFHRRRVLGTAGRQFDAFKFRTMYVDGDARLAAREGAVDELRVNHKLKADPRVTRVGAWLRRFSLDELPQLCNVLLGQMALVGPRMIAPAEAVKYGRNRLALFAVKPGITGLWQVSGRSDVSYEERIRFDLYYVRNYTIWLDLQILFQTIPAVLGGRGAY